MNWLIHSGGVFKLELFLPEEYPMAAPKVRHHNNWFSMSDRSNFLMF